MADNNILSKNQIRFVKNTGTKDALNYITDKIYDIFDKSKSIAIASLNLAKTFDTVNHEAVLGKLYNYGISGNAYMFISNYLKERKQQVGIEQTHSDLEKTETEVPQETILAHLFVIIYINDWLLKMNNEIISYANDTAVIASDDTWEKVESALNIYLNEIATWLALNKLN